MNDTLLETHDLVVQIAGKTVVDRLSFSLKAGQCLAILGRNGAGKSTLLSVLAGLRPARRGDVLIGGESYARLSTRTAARLRGWLPQHQGDAFSSTVLETALTGRHPHLDRWSWEGATDLRIARQALQAVGLQSLETRDVQTLSGGERQRLAIATLLAQQPRLFLLDEPLTHLDLNHQVAALEIFRQQMLAGAAIVSVLHDPGLAWRYATHVLLVHGDGRTELGPRDEMLTSERLSALYGHQLDRYEIAGRVGFIPG